MQCALFVDKSLFHEQSQRQYNANGEAQTRMQKMSWKKEIRAAKWFAVVLALFALCWLPLHLMNLVTLLTGHTSIPCIIVAVILSHANSAVNPILYAYSNSKFLSEFRSLLHMKHNAPD